MTAEILAGATDRHGRHERTDEGWDATGRITYIRQHGVDAGADSCGRHAAAGELLLEAAR